jgi:hypothetical protein
VDSGVLVFKFETFFMGKYYENLDTLIELIKKLEKKNQLAEFILDCITRAKNDQEKSPHEIIKESKNKFLK